MGRMLDSLKANGGTRVAPPALAKPGAETPAPDGVVDWEIAEDVPFIEVGGPNKKVELSPGLLKHPAQRTPQPPHLQIEKIGLALTPTQVVQLAPTKPMGVVFEPWPGAATTSIHAEIIAYHQPDHPTAKQYAALFDAMTASINITTSKTVLMLGLKANVGTTTVLANLGVIASLQRSLRVVLIDANTRRPGIAQKFGLSAAVGLAEVADGALAIEQALVPTCAVNLHLLPAGISTKSRPTARNEAMQWVTAWLRERFDLLLIDGLALDDAAELMIPLAFADGAYLVLPHGESSASKGAAQAVHRLGGRLSGLVHTSFDQ